MNFPEGLKFDRDGLIPAVIQDIENGDVLMMAWMNAVSLQQTIDTGLVTYWSRSRQELWVKGATSGHVQHLRAISVDCDMDCLLILVNQVGPACHDHYRSCFYRDVTETGELVVNETELLD